MVVNVWVGVNHGSGFVCCGGRTSSVVIGTIANVHYQNKREKDAGGNHCHFLCLGFHIKVYTINLDNIFLHKKFSKIRNTRLNKTNKNHYLQTSAKLIVGADIYTMKYKPFLIK